MIRFAKECDIDRIIELWTESFGYDEFAAWFFENIFDIENVLVYEVWEEDSEQVVAMLQRIPYIIKDFGEVTYIYGACTDLKYRKRGIMGKLLAYSEAIDVADGKEAIFLVPENEKLFSFYEKKGYDEYFYKYLRENVERPIVDLEKNKKYHINIEEIEMNTFDKEAKDSYYNRISDKMLELYNIINIGKQYIIRNNDYFIKQINMHLSSKGKVCLFYKNKDIIGYAFGYIEDEIYKISELVVDDDAYNDVISLLRDKYSNINVLNNLDGTVKIKYGCIKLLRKMLNINKIIINLVYD